MYSCNKFAKKKNCRRILVIFWSQNEFTLANCYPVTYAWARLERLLMSQLLWQEDTKDFESVFCPTFFLLRVRTLVSRIFNRTGFFVILSCDGETHYPVLKITTVQAIHNVFPPPSLLLVLSLLATLWIMEHMLQRLYIYDLARLNAWVSSPIFLTYFDLILNLPP